MCQQRLIKELQCPPHCLYLRLLSNPLKNVLDHTLLLSIEKRKVHVICQYNTQRKRYTPKLEYKKKEQYKERTNDNGSQKKLETKKPVKRVQLNYWGLGMLPLY